MTAPSTATRTPAVGDRVMFEGLMHKIAVLQDGKFEIHSLLMHTPGRGPARPRFITTGMLADLLWSNRLDAWYVWGRVLGKGRGGVGEDQRSIVRELRDRNILPSRPTRDRGAPPVAGEQHGLYCDLFMNQVGWQMEIGNVQRGEGLTERAKACCSDHEVGFKTKRLNHGYAARNDGDPGFDAVAGGK